ncbi:hypothetical protein Tco_0616668 [Tanacetum coccineum]
MKSRRSEQLESEVLVRSSKEAKTSHAVDVNLLELELKNILIDKMEANNSINRSYIQRQLYKALVDAYEADKILLDTYGDTVTIKRHRDGADDDQEPSAGTDRGSKRRRSGKEHESTSAPREKTTMTAGKTTTGSKTHKQSASQSAPVEETMQSTDVFEAPAHQEFKTGVHDEQPEEEVHHLPDCNLTRRQDPRESFDELTDTTFDFLAFVMNRLNVTTLTPELLAGPTFELMKGTCKSLTKLEYFCEEVYKATTEKLDWTNPEGSSDCDATIVGSKFRGESARDVYSKRQGIIAVTISVEIIRDLALMLLLLLVQGKVDYLNSEEHSNLRRRDAYTPYSDPRGFIYENKVKKNRLMRIDELHKFSDGTLDDVRTALNDRLKGIRIEYLPQTFWSQRDKANARAMIQAINKRLKTRRIMRSLERFVGWRPLGGDYGCFK